MQPSYQTTQLQPQWERQTPSQLQQQPQVPPPQTAQQPVQQPIQQPVQQQPVPAQQPGQQQSSFAQQPGQPQPTQLPGFAQQSIQQPAPASAQGLTPAPGQPSFQQQPGLALQPTLQPPGAGQFAGQSSMEQAAGMPMQQPVSTQQPSQGQAPPYPVQAQSATQPAPPASPMQPSGQQSPQSSPAQAQQPELGPGTVPQPLALDQELPATSPLVDILDSPEAITVYVDLPGCDEEDIQLKAVGNTLHISATRPQQEGDDDRPLQRERLGRIERTITLPVPINVEEAEASCEGGVCTITLPKSEESRQKSIAFQ